MPANNLRSDPVRRTALPTFDLSYDVDDREDPTTVTVYPETSDGNTTCWISIDVDHAVDLADIA